MAFPESPSFSPSHDVIEKEVFVAHLKENHFVIQKNLNF